MRARIVASAVTAAIVAATLAGCNFVTPVATMKHYDPSDGVSTTVGDIKILNAIVLTKDGQTGNLLLSAKNGSSTPVDLTVQYDAKGTKTTFSVKVPANGVTDLGYGSAGQQLLTNIGTPAGALIPIYFQYSTQPGVQLEVPVLDNSLSQYTNLLATPTPTPTVIVPVPSPTPTK